MPRPNRVPLCAALLTWLSLSFAAATTAQTPDAPSVFPKPTGHVSDFASVLDDAAESELETLLVQLEKDTTAQIAVATVTSLDGMSVEEYGNRMFNEWGVGQADKNNGVLVVVAPSARAMRIEVGYGLEAIIPDGLAGSIVRNEFLPAFRDGQYQSGIVAGVRRLATLVRRNRPVTADQLRALERQGQPPVIVLPGWVLLPFLGLIVAGGSYMAGVGTGAQLIAMLGLGLFVGGLGVALAWFYSPLAALAQAPLAAGIGWLGVRKGRSPKFRASARGTTKRTGWIVGASGGSSSRGSSGSSGGSSGGSFGGGRSGGGGASGRW